MTKKYYKNLNIMKGIAIFAVICAHTSSVPIDYSVINIKTGLLLGTFSFIGVPIFLFVSGYLFQQNENFNLLKTFKKIIFPWIISGSLVYLYLLLQGDKFVFKNYLNFLIGNGSYLYYMSIYVLIMIIMNIIKRNNKLIIAVLILSLLSQQLTAFGLITIINPFLNVFNWILYFIIGFFVSQRLEYLFKNKIILYLSIFISIIIYILTLTNLIELNYWSPLFPVFSLTSIVYFYRLSLIEKNKLENFVESMGRSSLSIYLYHMPIAGIITFYSKQVDIFIITLLRPIVVLLIMMLLLRIASYLFYKMNISNISKKYLGILEYE